MEEDKLFEEIPRIVKESYVEHILDELVTNQMEVIQELSDFKRYSNTKLELLEKRLFEINIQIKNARNGMTDLKNIDTSIKDIKN